MIDAQKCRKVMISLKALLKFDQQVIETNITLWKLVQLKLEM